MCRRLVSNPCDLQVAIKESIIIPENRDRIEANAMAWENMAFNDTPISASDISL